MLFHVTFQHYWDTCDGRKRAKGDPDAPPRNETNRWIEGNDKVKVLSAIGHQTQHRLFAIMEADDYQDVNDLVRPEMWNGPVEVLPCNDMVATRKRNGDWGK